MTAHLPPEILSHTLSLVVPFRFDVFPGHAADVDLGQLGFYDGYTIDHRRYSTYAACARVCKSWYTMAIRLLYHTIDLISPASYFLFFETIAIHNTSLAKYVQEFTGFTIWLDKCCDTQEVDFPSYLARSLLKSLPITKKLHLSAHFIPHLDQITSSEAGRDILEVSGHGDFLDDFHLRHDPEELYCPLSSVLEALPLKLSSLIIRHFEVLDDFDFYNDRFNFWDDWRPTYVLPHLHSFEMSDSVLTPLLAFGNATQPATLRCLTLSRLSVPESYDQGSLQSWLLFILTNVGLQLEEFTLTTYYENLLLTTNLLCLVPKLLRLRYKCEAKAHMPGSALLENLPKSLQALSLGFRRSDTSFAGDLFSALQKPSFLPDLATIPRIFLGGPPVDLNATYSHFSLGEKRDGALASLRARRLEWKSDGRGCRDWSSDSLRWSNSIWVQDFAETLSMV